LLEALDVSLIAAIRGAVDEDPLERLAHRIEKNRDLQPKLRQALALACRVDVPVRSVGDLASRVGRDRRILHLHSKEQTPTLKECLDWILLAKALRRKSPARSWESVAELLECPLGTLSRIASGRTGMPLAELSAVGREIVKARIEDLV
jgi:hypothetical protein